MASAPGILETVREDDFVEYFIFPNTNEAENEDDETKLLTDYLKRVYEIVEEYSKGYIWHKDCFNIAVRLSSSYMLIGDDFHSKGPERLPPHLYGVLHYGDNIEDEWFLVFLLLQLTKEIDDLIVRVVDNDGEFLLIEAANFLPEWASPETCEKKVYLYKGKLHVIRRNHILDEDDDNMDISKALEVIRKRHTLTEASTEIQHALAHRIDDYPDKIESVLHRAKVYVPLGVAAILNHRPQLIASAITAFCNRDPIDMKVCRAMKYFPPENRVYASVQFTKCLYAMLCHSKYTPDRRTGWNVPEPASPQFKSHNLGVRIACGFEILASQAKPSEDLENNKSWHNYLTSLKEKHYFRGLMEHSQEYNNLLNKAKDYFKEHNLTAQCSPALGREVLSLLKKLDYNMEDLKEMEENLPEDDDESWLQISEQELEEMLQERYGQNILNGAGAANLTGKLTEFLDHVSGIEGAEFPTDKPKSQASNESPPIRPQRGIKRKEKNKVTFQAGSKTESGSANNKINFDPNNFTCAIQNILDLVIPDDSWDTESGSEMSEYGDETEMDLDKMDPGQLQSKMKEYMEEMDRELSRTTIGQSFDKKKRESDNFDDIENFQPVDIDMTALKNMLESYQSEMGAAGPASTMLGPMGVHLQPSTSTSQTQDAAE